MIETTLFLSEEHSHISAILAGNTTPFPENEHNHKYILIHNINAKNRVPEGLFNVNEELTVKLHENNELEIIQP